MRLWVPVAFAGIVALAYLLFYVLDSLEGQGTNAFGLANAIGLVTVVVGIIAAGAVLRRTART